MLKSFLLCFTLACACRAGQISSWDLSLSYGYDVRAHHICVGPVEAHRDPLQAGVRFGLRAVPLPAVPDLAGPAVPGHQSDRVALRVRQHAHDGRVARREPAGLQRVLRREPDRPRQGDVVRAGARCDVPGACRQLLLARRVPDYVGL